MSNPTHGPYGADEARAAGCSSGTPAPAVSESGRAVENGGIVRIELPDAEVDYWGSFFAPDEARTLFDALRAEIRWERHRVRVRGREVDCPRLSGWEGDATYAYSGITLCPAPWTPQVAAVRRRIEAVVGEAFNSALANLYRDGPIASAGTRTTSRSSGPPRSSRRRASERPGGSSSARSGAEHPFRSSSSRARCSSCAARPSGTGSTPSPRPGGPSGRASTSRSAASSGDGGRCSPPGTVMQ